MIDIITAAQVIRLPLYHCKFNPIEMIWPELKAHIRRKNAASKSSEEVIALIKPEAANISPSSWKNCVRHVFEEENFYLSKIVPELIS